jgi:hypothetical protein
MPYMEQEERSQSEYKRGVSSWNFNVEDLKMQAAMIQDDDDSPTTRKAKEVEEVLKQVEEGPKSASRGTEGSASSSPKFLPTAAEPSLSRESSSERFQVPVTIHSIIAETANDVSISSPSKHFWVVHCMLLFYHQHVCICEQADHTRWGSLCWALWD